MTTLSSPPLAPLLTRLFAEADAPGSAETRAALSARSVDPSSWREFYGLVKDSYLAVSAETGRLLYMLARATNATTIVEFGTSFGISTLHLAAALRDNGAGRIITTEFEPSKAARARENFAAAGLDDLIELREGDATQTLASDLPSDIDLVLLDGAKSLYPAILDRLESGLAPGALVLADNADMSPDYLRRVRGDGYLSVPFAGDVELSMRVG